MVGVDGEVGLGATTGMAAMGFQIPDALAGAA
jgi:hypothetical protein